MIRFRLERTIQVRRSSLGVPGRPAGYIMLGVAMIRTATLPRWSGVLVAVGAPAHLLGFGIAQLVTTAAWPIAILRQRVSRRRARLGRLSALADTDHFGRACFRLGNGRMSTGSAERPVAKPQGTAHRVLGDHLRVVVTLAGLFFMVAVVLMASAPWVVLQPDQDVRTELNRWFLTFCRQRGDHSGCVLLVLAQRPRMLIVGLDGPMRGEP